MMPTKDISDQDGTITLQVQVVALIPGGNQLLTGWTEDMLNMREIMPAIGSLANRLVEVHHGYWSRAVI